MPGSRFGMNRVIGRLPITPEKRCLQCDERQSDWSANCASKVYGARGLCHRCYQRSRYMIAQGCETWEDLIKRGKALPSTAPKKPRKERMKEVILRLLENNEYPTAARIGMLLRKRGSNLTASECKTRTQIFEELEIKKRRSTIPYYNDATPSLPG